MKWLCIDTSSSFGTVAVADGTRLLAERSVLLRTRHEETLLPSIASVVRDAGLVTSDVDAFAVGLGPGGFTSLRVGIATVKGLALATGKPVVGIPSSRVIARGLAQAHAVAVVLTDAHRGEVFGAAYLFHGEGGEVLVPPMHGAPADVAATLRRAASGMPIVAAGDAFGSYAPVLTQHLGETAVRAPDAFDVPRAFALAIEANARHRVQGFDDVVTLEPAYVRPSDAKLPDKPLRIA